MFFIYKCFLCVKLSKMQHQKVDLFTNLLSENYDEEQIYTSLQPPSCSSICNAEGLGESPYNMSKNFSEQSQPSHETLFKPYQLSLEDQNCLKEILLSWNMEYLYETCIG